MTTLADARTALYDALNETGAAATYRGKRLNYDFPAFIVAPQRIDVRPSMGDARTFTIDVLVAVLVVDEDGAEDTADDLMETAITAIHTETGWDIRDIEFIDAVTNDGRAVEWRRLEVAVLS